jgi:ketosteroid isomerase-like protein
MSRENVEIVRRGYEAFARGGLDHSFLDFFDPDVDFRQSDELVGGSGQYRGHEGLIRGTRGLLWTFEEFSLEPERFIDTDGDHVVVFVRLRGRGRESGAAVDTPYAHVFKLRDGKVVLIHAYSDRAEALEAVGLSELDAHDRAFAKRDRRSS